MSTFTPTTKSTQGTFTANTKRVGGAISIGNPIGLLLTLTYSNAVAAVTAWTASNNKSSPTWTNPTKS